MAKSAKKKLKPAKKIVIKNKIKPKKKARPVKKAIKAPKPIGKVTHYFSNIKVAVIKLSVPLKEGSVIRIAGGEDTDFEQPVKSMQIDHKPVKLAKKGKSIGLKVRKQVRDGYKIFKA